MENEELPPSNSQDNVLTTESTQKEYTSQQWKKDIVRLVRRSAIERYMDSSTTLEEVKTSVKKFEHESGVDEVIEGLTEQEYSIDPTIGECATEISEELLSLFPQVKGIVLLGSSVEGGSGNATCYSLSD